MSDKHLSGEEKRQKMKEEFKKELRARKEFLNKVKGLRRTQSINKALESMNVEDDTDQWIEKLNQETAFREAKTEMALETAGASNLESGTTPEQELAISEEEMQKIAAEQMVARMKAEMLAEAEGGVASPNLSIDAETEVKTEVPSGRLIEVEISEDGEVTGSETTVEPPSEGRLIEVEITGEGDVTGTDSAEGSSPENAAETTTQEESSVRRMMGGAIEGEGDNPE